MRSGILRHPGKYPETDVHLFVADAVQDLTAKIAGDPNDLAQNRLSFRGQMDAFGAPIGVTIASLDQAFAFKAIKHANQGRAFDSHSVDQFPLRQGTVRLRQIE